MPFDAAAFLESITAPAVPTPPRPQWGVAARLGIGVGDLSDHWREAWEERSAIMEFDGGLSREAAEARALDDIVFQMKRDGERDVRERR